jgi:hypothetical protein
MRAVYTHAYPVCTVYVCITSSLEPLKRIWGCWFHKLLILHHHVYLTNRTEGRSVTTEAGALLMKLSEK